MAEESESGFITYYSCYTPKVAKANSYSSKMLVLSFHKFEIDYFDCGILIFRFRKGINSSANCVETFVKKTKSKKFSISSARYNYRYCYNIYKKESLQDFLSFLKDEEHKEVLNHILFNINKINEFMDNK